VAAYRRKLNTSDHVEAVCSEMYDIMNIFRNLCSSFRNDRPDLFDRVKPHDYVREMLQEKGDNTAWFLLLRLPFTTLEAGPVLLLI
jgi:hypothetical protein